MTSKSLESIPTMLAPLVDLNPMSSTHNNIIKKVKIVYTRWGATPNPLKNQKTKSETKEEIEAIPN
jgi:hypothetical protein